MTDLATTVARLRDLLTIEDWEALPEDDTLRLEVAEGVLMMSPKPFPWHRHAATELAHEVEAQLPRDLVAVADAEVVLADDPLTIRAPDTLVTRTAVYETNPPRFRAADVLLTAEILSDGTRRVDRVMKFSEYADAGIAQYWIIDLDAPTTLTAYLLVDGDYELVAECTGVADLDVAGHPVRLDLDALTRR